MRRSLAAVAVLLLVPVPASLAAEFDPDCRAARDAGAPPAAVLITRHLSCRGTLSGADPADWYDVHFAGPLEVLVVPNARADFDLCVFYKVGGAPRDACTFAEGPAPERLRLDVDETGPWSVVVFAFSGSGEYVLTLSSPTSPTLQRVSGALAPAGAASAGRAVGEAAAWVEEACAPASVAAACGEDANRTIEGSDIFCTPPVTPGQLCTRVVSDLEHALHREATDEASSAYGNASRARRDATSRPGPAPPEAWPPDGAADGRWIRLAPPSTGREWVTLAVWPNATVGGSPPEGEVRFFRGQREIGSCARVGFEECAAPWSADRALVTVRGAAQMVGFEMTYDAAARDADDCGSGRDAGDVLETAHRVPVAGTLGCGATFDAEDRVDWYAVELQEGEALRVDVTPAPGTDVDACLFSAARQRVACSATSGAEPEAVQAVAERAGTHFLLVRAFSGTFSAATPYGMAYAIGLPPKLDGDCGFAKDAGASLATAANLSLVAPVLDCVGHIGGVDTTDLYGFYVGIEDIVGSAAAAASFLVRVDAPEDAEVCVFDPEGASLGCAVETEGEVPGEGLARHILGCLTRAGEHAVLVTSGTRSDYTLTFGLGTSRGPLGTVQTLCGTAAVGTGTSVPACVDASRQRVDGDRVGVSGCLGPSRVQRADLGPVWNPARNAAELAKIQVQGLSDEPIVLADLRGPARGAVHDARHGANLSLPDEGQVDGRWIRLEESDGGVDPRAIVEGLAPDTTFEVYFFAEEDGEPAARVDDGACTGGSACRVPQDAGFAYVQATGGAGGEFAFATVYHATTTGRLPDNAAEPVIGLFCAALPGSC